MTDSKAYPFRAVAPCECPAFGTITIDIDGTPTELLSFVPISKPGETIVINWVSHLSAPAVTSSESAGG